MTTYGLMREARGLHHEYMVKMGEANDVHKRFVAAMKELDDDLLAQEPIVPGEFSRAFREAVRKGEDWLKHRRDSQPLTKAPGIGESYWVPAPDLETLAFPCVWCGVERDRMRLSRGIAFRAEQAAVDKAKEMLGERA